ncbi:helix-turn-helix domain-containing protein [Halomarina pelagica]|uniref:helix-turn-helix domain-containing protein n=1 Tax=Halomarina pelagica TaxID=2961599 RepID=UPI0020C256EA|nr:helix-turn-helix domain-containing protein [Halomarina sp. BND7]
MKEYAFAVEYPAGVDPLADLFIDHPGAMAKSIACVVSDDSMWRVDRVTGPTEAIDAIEACALDPERCNECPPGDCASHREYEVLTRDATTCTYYSYRTDIDRCPSLPSLAADHLGDGVLYESVRRGGNYTWRVLVRRDVNVGRLFDALQDAYPDGVAVTLSHLRSPTHWGDEAISIADLPYEQREALEAAVEHGYYATPRESSLGEVAERVEIPHSTFQYRLQRAESWLANNFVSECLQP